MAASQRPHVSLFNLAERTITVADLVGDRELWVVEAARSAAEVAVELKEHDFEK